MRSQAPCIPWSITDSHLKILLLLKTVQLFTNLVRIRSKSSTYHMFQATSFNTFLFQHVSYSGLLLQINVLKFINFIHLGKLKIKFFLNSDFLLSYLFSNVNFIMERHFII